MTVVEYCLCNVDRATRERLAAAPVEDRPRRCCQRCGDCRAGPMLVVDGDLATGEDHAALLDRALADGERSHDHPAPAGEGADR